MNLTNFNDKQEDLGFSLNQFYFCSDDDVDEHMSSDFNTTKHIQFGDDLCSYPPSDFNENDINKDIDEQEKTIEHQNYDDIVLPYEIIEEQFFNNFDVDGVQSNEIFHKYDYSTLYEINFEIIKPVVQKKKTFKPIITQTSISVVKKRPKRSVKKKKIPIPVINKNLRRRRYVKKKKKLYIFVKEKEQQKCCCIIGCDNGVRNRLRHSLHFLIDDDCKVGYITKKFNKVCHYHYFSDHYQFKKKLKQSNYQIRK